MTVRSLDSSVVAVISKEKQNGNVRFFAFFFSSSKGLFAVDAPRHPSLFFSLSSSALDNLQGRYLVNPPLISQYLRDLKKPEYDLIYCRLRQGTVNQTRLI